jgi:pimeloyl-ACP methyl ester carboxylesterase
MHDWQQGDVSANGVTIHYYRTGGSNKSPLLLAHGFTDNGLCWTRVAQALMTEFDVVMVDARNHGFSGAGKADVQTLATDLAAVVAELGLGQVSALGHSVGASVVTALAADFPHLVKRIILEDPPWRRPRTSQRVSSKTPPPRDAAFRKLIAQMARFSDEKMLQHGRSQHPTWPDEEYVPWGLSNRQVSADAMALLDLGEWQTFAERVQCPSLVIYADATKDGIITSEMADHVQQLNSVFTAAQVGDAGHNIRRENFTAYIALVRAFLARS